MAVVSIKYDEENPDTYELVELSTSAGVTYFASGIFIKDWYDCNKAIIMSDLEEPVAHSSSVDHFIMDGAPYDSVYLCMEGEKPVLKYVDYSNPDFVRNENKIYEEGVEYFIPEGMKITWDALRILVGDPKK